VREPHADGPRTLESLTQAIRARDRTMAIVAHDLRNPLEVIATSASLLMMTLHEPYVRRHLERIVHVTQRAAVIIDQLIDVDSLEGGTPVLLKSPLYLASTIKAAAESQAALAEKNGISISLEVPAALARVDADPERLEEVLQNLLANALKFTEGGGHISVGAMPRGSEVLVWVKDTGRGIPDAELPHLFERLSQEHPQGRTRLGLGICKTIIEAHAGRIWVESAAGRGTTVFFTLPATHEE
jgi:signal transduction histidine kinase